jgi:phosphatidylglycerophosphate synthase
VITEAALYLASPADASTASSAVAGRPVAFRMLMAAVRAGCRRVYVPDIFRASHVERAIAATPSARAAAVWLAHDAKPPGGPLLLLPAAAVVPPSALAPLLTAPPLALLTASRGGDAPVVAAGAALAATLWTSIAAGRPLGDALGRALQSAEVAAIPGPGWYVRAVSPAARKEAEAHLCADLASAIDTWLDTVFHRRLSRPLSRAAVAAGMTPNQVTLASLLVGLGAVWCFWQATPARALVGLVFYAGAVVLDHADGEVARLTLSESPFGAWLDVAVDTAIHALLVVAMGMTAQQVGGDGAALAGLLAAIGVVASATLTQTSPPARGGRIGVLLDALSNRDGFYAMLVIFILGLALRPGALPALMIFLAVGCHAFWLSRLVYRLTRLS